MDETIRSSSFSDIFSSDKSPSTYNVSSDTKIPSKIEDRMSRQEETSSSISEVHGYHCEDFSDDFESPLTRNYSLQGIEKQKALLTSFPRIRNLQRGRGVATQTDLSFLRDLMRSPSSGSRKQPSSGTNPASLKGKSQTSCTENGKDVTNVSGDDNSNECTSIAATKERSKNVKEMPNIGLPHCAKTESQPSTNEISRS